MIEGLRVPWTGDNFCPCGSGAKFKACCQGFKGNPVGRIPNLRPPGADTGYAHPKCYLSDTANCSTKISSEHLVSKSISKALGNFELRGGLSVLGIEERAIVSDKTTVNRLCKRHNEALSPLDQAAGHFFKILRTISESGKSLSKKDVWFLADGISLELWALKTLCAFYYGNMMVVDGKHIRESSFDRGVATAALTSGHFPKDAGMYFVVGTPVTSMIGLGALSNGGFVRGLRLRTYGMDFDFIVNQMSYYDVSTSGLVYRPSIISTKVGRRMFRIVLTWDNDVEIMRSVSRTMRPAITSRSS